MATMQELREGVRCSLPEVLEISDQELQDKVVEVWAIALAETDFTSIDDMTCNGMIGTRLYPGKTQSDHQRGVGRIARAIALEMRDLYGEEIDVDPELALASGLLHDVGKPFFYSMDNVNRWREHKVHTGKPPFRHTMYGAHLALQVGLPEELVHCIASHDLTMDGQFVIPSVYAKILSYADRIYWGVLDSLGLLVPDPSGVEQPAG
jgi:putative nucleotidyltransferase with HDIG domain